MHDYDTHYHNCLKLIDDPGNLFRELHKVWFTDIGEDKTVSGQVLAKLQNEGHGCAFTLATTALSDCDCAFDVIHLLEKALPFFDALNIDAVFAFEKAVHETVKNDLAGGILRNKYMTRFASNPDEALEAIDKHLKAPTEETGPTFRAALVGLAAHNHNKAYEIAVDAAKSPEFFIAANAISALGAFNWVIAGGEKQLEAVMEILDEHTTNPKSKLLYISAWTLQQIVAQRPTYHSKLTKLGEEGTPEGLTALSNFLWLNLDNHHNNQWFLKLLTICARTPADCNEAIKYLDYALSGILKKDGTDFDASLWLAEWVGHQRDGNIPVDIPKAFHSTFRQMISKPDLLSNIFTTWLTHENSSYPSAVHKIAGELTVRKISNLSFDMSLVNNMDTQDLVHLVRRTLGWIFNATLRINLLWSLTQSTDAHNRTYGVVNSTFSDHLGYEYPHEVREFIEPIRGAASDGKLIALCDDIINSMDMYQTALNELKQVKELKTLPEKYRLFRKAREKEMQQAKEDAKNQSVFMQLATTYSVKAGTGTFHRQLGGKDYSDRSPFTSFSTTMSLPMSVFTNTVGSEHQTLLFRYSKRGE
ncbi:MAG: hypothetical protein AB7E51_08520 [Pseudodesulfovibrio sp.]|uniref:hypothetical protein n=1 Tax=Pseudodesulfovibrio sp. TaxID=2035812 RepID=UPI003D13F6FB